MTPLFPPELRQTNGGGPILNFFYDLFDDGHLNDSYISETGECPG